jgi:hypothetical protein
MSTVIYERLTDDEVEALTLAETSRDALPVASARLLAKAIRQQCEAASHAEESASFDAEFWHHNQLHMKKLEDALKELAVAAEELASYDPDMPADSREDVEARFDKALDEANRLTAEPDDDGA